MSKWQSFRTFVKDQLTTPVGDFDPARIWGYAVVGFGGMIYNALEIYSVVWGKAAFDPNAYADGLIKVGAALVAAATGVWIKSGRSVEVPLPTVTATATDGDTSATATATDPNSPAQAATLAADAASAAVTQMGALANTELTQANGVLTNVKAFWVHVRSFWKKD